MKLHERKYILTDLKSQCFTFSENIFDWILEEDDCSISKQIDRIEELIKKIRRSK